MVQSAFTAEERRRDEHVLFVSALLNETASPVQLAPYSMTEHSGSAEHERPHRGCLAPASDS